VLKVNDVATTNGSRAYGPRACRYDNNVNVWPKLRQLER
jgi:hypothetical protein